MVILKTLQFFGDQFIFRLPQLHSFAGLFLTLTPFPQPSKQLKKFFTFFRAKERKERERKVYIDLSHIYMISI